MKKIFLTLAVLGLMTFASCGNQTSENTEAVDTTEVEVTDSVYEEEVLPSEETADELAETVDTTDICEE